jgi:DNA-binding transcriptional ArsR family regulator
MPTLDDHIAQALRESQRSGELQSARGYGQPLDFGDGYDQTPAELRMAFKALKDAGFVPPEVETMKQIAALAETLRTCTDEREADTLRRRLSELRQHVALRLEKLRVTGSL